MSAKEGNQKEQKQNKVTLPDSDTCTGNEVVRPTEGRQSMAP